MEERTGVPAIDDASYLRGVLDEALGRLYRGEDRLQDALIPEPVAGEIFQSVEKLSAWIPFAREIPGEWPEPSRWTRLRWRLRDARYSARRWIHGILFPEEERALRAYEDDPR